MTKTDEILERLIYLRDPEDVLDNIIRGLEFQIKDLQNFREGFLRKKRAADKAPTFDEMLASGQAKIRQPGEDWEWVTTPTPRLPRLQAELLEQIEFQGKCEASFLAREYLMEITNTGTANEMHEAQQKQIDALSERNFYPIDINKK